MKTGVRCVPHGMLTFIFCALTAVTAAMLARATDAPNETIRWEIWREGEKVGYDTMTIHRQAGRLIAEREIDIAVRRVGVVTVYRYVRREKETWLDGKLAEFAAITNDDEKETSVEVERTATGLTVDGDAGRFAAPPALVPSTLWRIDMTKSDAVFDVEHGKMLSVHFTTGAEMPLPVKGRDVPARHIIVSGDLSRDLWYGPDGMLVRAQFADAEGVLLDYRIAQP